MSKKTITCTVTMARPSDKEVGLFYKLYHAAQRVEDRWCHNTVGPIADELSHCPNLTRQEKMFLLRSWQVLVDGSGGFGRFMGAFDTYVYNMQDPAVDHVAYKPSLIQLFGDAELLPVVIEAYQEALAALEEKDRRIAELEISENQLIAERDSTENALNDMYRTVMDEPPEWSNMFQYDDAVESVDCRIADLEQRLQQPAVPSELLDAMDEVIRISDRDHEAWHRAKSAISAYRAAMLNHSEGVLGIVLDERAAFDAWNNEDNLPIAGIPAKNAAWLGWQARAALQLSGNSEQVEPVSHGYTLPAGFCDAGLTRFDLSALQKMPESEWFSWKDDRLKGVNRPHYRCFRLLEAGFLESRVTNPEAPYQSVEFRKIEAQTTPAAPDEIDRFVDQVCGDKPADHQQ